MGNHDDSSNRVLSQANSWAPISLTSVGVGLKAVWA